MNLKWRWCSPLCSNHKQGTTLGLVQCKTLKMCESRCQVLTTKSVVLQTPARVGLYWLLMWLPHEVGRLISWRDSNQHLLSSKKYSSLHAKQQVRVMAQSCLCMQNEIAGLVLHQSLMLRVVTLNWGKLFLSSCDILMKAIWRFVRAGRGTDCPTVWVSCCSEHLCWGSPYTGLLVFGDSTCS